MPEARPTTAQPDDVVGAPIPSDPALWAAIIALHMRGAALELGRELRDLDPWGQIGTINCRCVIKPVSDEEHA